MRLWAQRSRDGSLMLEAVMDSKILIPSEQPAERGSRLLRANALYDQADIADFLGLSKRTLVQWRADGVGPRFRRIRKRVVYLGSDVNGWVLSDQDTDDAGTETVTGTK